MRMSTSLETPSQTPRRDTEANPGAWPSHADTRRTIAAPELCRGTVSSPAALGMRRGR